MPVMKNQETVLSGVTTANVLAGLDFEFVRDSVITLWASASGVDLAMFCTFLAGTTALGRNLRLNLRAAPLQLEDDLLIARELVEGNARLSLSFRNEALSGTPTGQAFWQLEVAPL